MAETLPGATMTASRVVDSSSGGRPAPQLFVLLRGDDLSVVGSRHVLDYVDRVQLGRGTDAAVRETVGGVATLRLPVSDGRVSTTHARLVHTEGVWTLEDLGSKNGTLHNGAPVKSKRLADGDIFEVGRTIFLYRDASPIGLGTAADTDEAGLESACSEWATFSDPLANGYRQLARVAESAVPLLVLGPPGAGKEVVAQPRHQLSGRSGDCVAVNCAAIPETLVEAELFGAKKGAFTGADEARVGWIRAAHRGTLFLDEIGELRPQSQAALLRALEARAVVPVGDHKPVPVDFRLVAATNRDIDAEVEAGRFRADLRSRLGAATLQLPAMADRREDFGILLRAVLERLTPGGASWPAITSGAAHALLMGPWPGNIRELVQTISFALAQCDDVIDQQHLPTPPSPRTAPTPEAAASGNLREELAALEKTRILQALERYPKQADAAKSLGIPIRTFYNRLDALGIPRPRK